MKKKFIFDLLYVFLCIILLTFSLSFSNCNGDNQKQSNTDGGEDANIDEEINQEEAPPENYLSILTPEDGSILSGSVLISFDYSTPPESITVYLDSSEIQTLESGATQLELDTSLYTDGGHILGARGIWENAQVEATPVNIIIDNLPPVIDEENFIIFSIVSGAEAVIPISIFDSAGLKRIEIFHRTNLIADITGEPFTPVFDSTRFQDGAISLMLRVTDLAGHTTLSDELPLLIVNDGRIIQLTEGTPEEPWTTLEIIIPENYQSVELDLKDHWIMPSSITSIMSAAVVSGKNWITQYDIGIGWCPHSGEVKKADYSERGIHIITLSASELGLEHFVSDEQWFAHIHPVNPQDHIGEKFSFRNIVIVYE